LKIAGIILAIVLFLLLVIIHEAGHFFAAKMCGVRVLEFSVGMGPLIFQRKKKETEYSLRAVPIGGYCKLEAEDGESDDPKAFVNATWWKRLIILAAGAFNNILLCLIVLFFIFLYSGSYSSVLDIVIPGGAADIAGIKPGDELVSVDGVYYDSWSEIVNAIAVSDGEISIAYLRDGSEESVSVVPEYNETEQRYMIGIQCSVVHSAPIAIKETISTCLTFIKDFGQIIPRLLQGKVNNGEVVGVVGVVSMVSKEAEYGIINVIYLMAMISLNLGAVNLLPFPALDGGRILFVFIRAISRGKLDPRIESYVHAAGMAILFALMAFLIFNDTINLLIH